MMTTQTALWTWDIPRPFAGRVDDVASDEQRLVLQCQSGDKAAFRQLVQRYQRKVYGIAFGMVRNPDDAMDLTQEAFIRVYKNLDRFKGSSSFYTWLYRIVMNLCIDHLRKARRDRAAEYDDARAPSTEAAASGLLPDRLESGPSEVLQRRESRRWLEKALEQLSPSHRAVLLMREVEGLSYAEMAEALGCAKGTIMSRLFHARRNMQRALLEAAPEGAPASATDLQQGPGAELAASAAGTMQRPQQADVVE